MLLRATIVIVLTLGLAAAACGDGGTPEPTATYPPGFTPQPEAFLTPAPPPPVDPNMPLTEYVETERSPKFAISHPSDWRMEQGPSDVKWFFETEDRGRVAFVAVTCLSQESPEAAARSAAAMLDKIGAPWQPHPAQTLRIDDREAVLWAYTVSFGSGEINQLIYYIQGSGCVWELRGVIFALRPLGPMEQLFHRIAGTFREIEE